MQIGKENFNQNMNIRNSPCGEMIENGGSTF